MSTSLWADLVHLEAELRRLQEKRASSSEYHAARVILARLICQILKLPEDCPPPFLELIDLALSTPGSRSAVALLVLRALGDPELLPVTDTGTQLGALVVSLIEESLPDLFKSARANQQKQTFQKIDALRATHSNICARLAALRDVPNNAEAFLLRRQDVLKAINNDQVQQYLGPFLGKKVAAYVESIFVEMAALLQTNDHTFGEKLTRLKLLVAEQHQWSREHDTFLCHDYYEPFLVAAIDATNAIARESKERFDCNITQRRAGEFVLEKRYPLREANRLITVSVPLANSGPGVAKDVSVQILTEANVILASDVLNIGDIPPGDFAIAIQLVTGEGLSELRCEIEVSWATLSSPTLKQQSFSVLVLAQSLEVDWPALERLVPYNTSIAEGQDFVGRNEKVIALSTRLLKERLESSYITGQKRVGKSSLAIAVRDRITSIQEAERIRFKYIEYGEYAHPDPRDTVNTLGGIVAEFLLESIPPHRHPKALSFSGSLAPIARLLDAANETNPSRRFVVILDEFDEIPPELYRMGALAETFFSNLRTLSSKRNLALMLVGGENMPFIVSAQGDQLNKFVRESLDYFSRDEWTDYVNLVESPVRGRIRWHESAINKVFTLTNGHPYYTKLLCARTYHNAVTERDADVSAAEIERAYNQLVASLDLNAFAHLWRDSISGSREEAEVIALQRCRILAAIARTCRLGQGLTIQNITLHKHTNKLNDGEIQPLVADFCRRGILDELPDGSFTVVLPIFRDWLAQSGINRLVTDTLGDELADGIQKAEDAAFVKDGEICTVAERWPAYRGTTISAANIRAWLAQVPSHSEQRLLFKLLQNLTFFSEMAIRERLKVAHSLVLKSVPEFVRRSPADRRRDILVAYVDGAAKSGHFYASRYAEENLIDSSCVKEMGNFDAQLREHEEGTGITINAIVIVDDFVGTGESLAANLMRFLQNNRAALVLRSAFVVVVAIAATSEGERRVRDAMRGFDGIRVDLRVCEPLNPATIPFADTSKVWASPEEKEQAKALCLRLGSGLSRNQPLGFKQQGLLVVFPTTCPNNTLPILHQAKSGKTPWTPLFPRPKN